jgi:Domain of unknown function (DUF4288)
MAHIPRNAEWYVAEIINEIVVEGDVRNVVHKNLTLVHASSPDEAYDRAVELGQQGISEYQNPAGKKVVIRFRGLGALNVVYDPIEHGAELRYTEDISVPEQKITELVRAKEQLSVFKEIEPTRGPDYSSMEIVDETYQLMGREPERQK